MNKNMVLALLFASASAIRMRNDDDELKLPAVVDENDQAVDKLIMAQVKKVDDISSKDDEMIETFQKQLDQGLRNAKQGEMGQALAVSKLSTIKQTINQLQDNLKEESEGIQGEVKAMLEKHNQVEIDASKVDKLEKKSQTILAQFGKINELEGALEIQDKDAELATAEQKIKSYVQATKKSVTEGNKKIRETNNQIPESARIPTDAQYEDQMAFVLKH